jgi:2-methylcitrate dehydratase (2-methyl-trans-aconitate forming)
MPDGAVIIAAITSCTNTSNPRNVVAAGLAGEEGQRAGSAAQALGQVVLRSGLQGRQVVPGRCRSAAGAGKARLRHRRLRLHHLQRHVRRAGSGDPAGNHRPRPVRHGVLSGNRNFDGRIHPYAKQAFLASPPLVVAYAIAGTVRFDIEQDVLGTDPDGNPVTLKDLWPSDEEIDAIVAASVKPEQFKQIYIPMFDLGTIEEAKSPLYDWRPMSTYIRRPPYWEGALAGERTLKGMLPLAILPDNITTDHLSPSNAILLDGRR